MVTVATAIIIQMYIIIIEPQNETEHPINMLLVHMQKKKIKAAGECLLCSSLTMVFLYISTEF